MFGWPLSLGNKLILLASVWLVFMLGQPDESLAHSVLKSSSLGDKPVPAQTATTVTLAFSGRIQAGLSKVLLVSKGMPEQALKLKAGDNPGELLVDLPALAEGEYALRYRVFAADGHLTENLLKFRVSPPQ